MEEEVWEKAGGDEARCVERGTRSIPSVVEGPASLTGSSMGLGTVWSGRADEVGETSSGRARACCEGFGERADRVGFCAK
jgi:hypothetical protein